jgi:hypothetical protein
MGHMSERMYFKTVFLVAALLLAACSLRSITKPVNANVAADPPPRTALMFSDVSGGALWGAYVHHQAATALGYAVTYTQDVEEFTTRLAIGNWSKIFVMVRHSGQEPAFLSSLRSFASAHGDVPVQFHVWHDNGVVAPAYTAMSGSAAVVLWLHSTTTTGYAYVNAPPEIQSVTGLHYPTFSGISVKNPIDCWSVSQQSIENAVQPAEPQPLPSNCRKACYDNVVAEFKQCDTNQQTQLQQCRDLYGPQGEDPGNPVQYVICANQAAQDWSNCNTAAVNRFNNCISLCEKRGV